MTVVFRIFADDNSRGVDAIAFKCVFEIVVACFRGDAVVADKGVGERQNLSFV